MGPSKREGRGNPLPALVLVCAGFVFAATNALSAVVFDRTPHVHDELSYLFQAKIFALGKATAASPSPREAFDFPHVVNNGRWYSQYPPGFPLLLALGWVLGMPWAVNPVLAALSAIVFYLLGKELYGEAEGRLAAVLGALSPWFLLTSATMMSHASSLLFCALFLLFSFRALSAPSFREGLLAGASLGMALLIRPYNAALIAVPMLAFGAIRLVRDRRRGVAALAGLAAALFVAAAVLLAYNQATNGHPLRWGYTERYGAAHGLGFGRAGYMGVPHSPALGLSLLGENLEAINAYLFGWPLSSLFFLLPLWVPWKDDARKRRADVLLALSFFALALGLFFYWGTHVFLGARMYFEALPLLVLCTARGISRTPALLSRAIGRADPGPARKAVRALVAVLSIYAFGVTFPRWVRPAGTKDFDRVMAADFCGVSRRLARAVESSPVGRSVVILKLLYAPKPYFPESWWGSGFLRDDPALRGDVIYVRDRGAANARLLGSFPDRAVFLYVGTLDKGVLMPVAVEAGALRYGPPVTAGPGVEGASALVPAPIGLFRPYSEAFRDHMEAVLRENFPDRIDGPRLAQMAAEREDAGELRAAVFDLEAALQIENDESVRLRLLARLPRLYLKTGDAALAERVRARLQDPSDPRVYDVCPERGY